MLGTVRTSIGSCSAKGIDRLPRKGERKRFDKFPIMLDIDRPVMRGERRHDVLPFQFPADEVFGAVELDTTVGIDLANPRDQAFGNRKGQMTPGVKIWIDSKADGQMTESRPELISKESGKTGSLVSHGETPARLPDVIILEESIAATPNGPKIGAAVPQDPHLPSVVEALHGRVAAWLPLRNEDKLNAEEKMQPDDLGEAVAIAAASRSCHLVVHLGDPGKAHNSPGFNKMAEERDRLFIEELMGRNGLADDIDGVEGIEPSDSPGSSQIAGTDQVGLLEITHLPGSNVWIGRSTGSTLDLDLFRLAGPGQNLFNGRDDREMTNTPVMELIMDRLGPDAGESRAAGLVGRQFVTENQDFADNRLSSSIPDMLRGATPVSKSLLAELPEPAQPLGEPEVASLHPTQDLVETDPVVIKPNRLDPKVMFVGILHRFRLLPKLMGRSLGDKENTYRCPYGFLPIDVLMETP